VARWNGSNWAAFGSGTVTDVFALGLGGQSLFVGGGFQTAGGKTSKFIGQWDDVIVGVDDAPATFTLEAPIPSPARGTAAFSYRLAEAGRVRLTIHDPRGRQVATLVDGVMPAGRHQAAWNGEGASSGVYFARLDDGRHERVQRFVRID